MGDGGASLAHQLPAVQRGTHREAIAHKGMLLAGKVLAATAIRLFSDRALLEASQREVIMVGACRYAGQRLSGAVWSYGYRKTDGLTSAGIGQRP
jgi:hypothetical protein